MKFLKNLCPHAQCPTVLRAIISLHDFLYSGGSLKVPEKILDFCSPGLYNILSLESPSPK